jgi:ATP-dependent RNA helicase DeaD
MITFKDLSLSPDIQKALDKMGFTNPTEIQEKAIPILLKAEKVDLLGQAQTGTGKTLAFGIPLLHKIDSSLRTTQALIVAPTRELVVQIRDSIRQVASPSIAIEAIYGGVSMVDQMRALKKGAHIVVGTPGRLNDHLRRGTLSLKQINTLVLDEADTMLDMGFKDEVDEILKMTSTTRQIWLFSATIKAGINDLMRSHMKDPVSILVNRKESAAPKTKQFYSVVPRQHRLEALCRFIDCAPEFYGFIFCQTKVLTAEVSEKLTQRGYTVQALHGDMSQVLRNEVIKKFKRKDFTILVCTDVAARGIDVSDITHVVNFSLPDDQESYVHRVGRTGRAGKEGLAITLIANSEIRRIQYLTQKFKFEINPMEVPGIAAIVKKQHEKAMALVTSTNQELSVKNSFIDALHTQINELSKEAVTFALVNALYEKFLQHAIPAKNIEFSSSSNNGYSHSRSSNMSSGSADELQEFFMNIGSDDGIEKSDIINYLVSSEKISHDDIKKIKVLRRHTFVVVPGQQAQPALDALQGKDLNGLRVRINITNEVPELNNRRSSGYSDSRSSSRGHYGSSESSHRGNFRRSSGSRGGSSRAYQG